MNSRNSLKQWLTRRRVKDFFLAADGDNVGPRAQPVALLDKPNFRNIASVEANPTNTQAHLPRQEKQSKSALRLSRLSLCLCTLCLSLLLKITRGLSIPSSDHILHILCLIKFPLFFGVFCLYLLVFVRPASRWLETSEAFPGASCVLRVLSIPLWLPYFLFFLNITPPTRPFSTRWIGLSHLEINGIRKAHRRRRLRLLARAIAIWMAGIAPLCFSR